MAALALSYVLLGEAIDQGWIGQEFGAVETLVTAIFIGEYSIRLWASSRRADYFVGHLPDLVALLPASRGLRLLRLVRLLRLIRTIPLVYRRLGLDLPIVRRLGWHAKRVGDAVDRRLLAILGGVILGVILVSAVVITGLEKGWTTESLGNSLYWAINTVLGSGDPSYVTSPAGWALSWTLIGLGLTLLAIATGAIVSFVLDVALKEGRGMGAAGYQGHVVVCGWSPGAREIVEELMDDEYPGEVVLLAPLDRNPVGSKVYFVSGDPTAREDLERAGIRDALAAVVFPADETDAADMRSILVVLAIESLAPNVRTVVQVNNQAHVEHLRRAHADEIIVPSRIAAHLAARSAVYPGLTDLVNDMVSGGEGAELYRVSLPTDYVGSTVADVAARLLRDQQATLLALSREGQTISNPPADMPVCPGDDALVLASTVSDLAPLPLGGTSRKPSTAGSEST